MTARRSLLQRSPALAVAATGVLLALLAAVGILIVLATPYPLTPWDAGALVEGWRAATGMPVYEPLEGGHATHMYGALAPYTFGAILRLTGPSVLALKLVSLACALALGALLLVATARLAPRRWWMTALLVGMFLCLDARAAHYFLSARPDIIELGIAAAALVVMYRAVARDRFPAYLGGAALLIVAFFFKQPAAFLALIPGLALLLERRWPLRRRLAWGAVPPLAILLTVLALRAAAPTVFFYMITIPGSYEVPFLPSYPFLTDFLRSFPVIWLVGLALAQQWGELAERSEWRWAAAALVVTVPTSLVVAAKAGGGENAWLPALLVLLFVCALALPRTFAWLDDERRSLQARLAGAALLATAAWVSFGDQQLQVVRRRPHADDHRALIQALRALPPSQVLSPGDPTLTLLAHGKVERTFVHEFDARPLGGWWQRGTPAAVRRDIEASRYVVTVDSAWTPLAYVPLLDSLGFSRVRRFGFYEIRERPDTSSDSGRRQIPSTDFPTR